MSNSTAVLLDIGSNAYAHQAKVDEVKRQMGIDHNYFDCWIYGFLENKNFNVSETVAKLNRRDTFEKEELGRAEITDWMMENMQKGIIQVIGSDKAGRVTLYICTGRDSPQSSRRDESRKNFDMFVSYATRLRPESKRCQLAMLINQDKASIWRNVDMTFQTDIAFRIAKYYPGCVDKMYICKMSRTLSALAKPLFSSLSSIVSDRIIIISDGDINNGKLLELYDASVLPIALGGKNDCDKQENYTRFAYTIKEYFEQLKAAIQRGSSVKEWELSNLRAAGYTAEGSRMDALRMSIIGRPSPGSSPAERGLFSDHAGSLSSSSVSVRGVSELGIRDGDAEDVTLLTCDTISKGASQAPRRSVLRIEDSHLQPRDLFSDYLAQFAAIESFFRLSITEMYEREWLAVVQQEVNDRRELLRMGTEFRGDAILKYIPSGLVLVARGFLWLCMMVMSSYYLLASLFIAILSAVTLVYIFFSMFTAPYSVFLYGVALIVMAIQFVIFCSRGFELCKNTFDGRILRVLQPLGNKALIVQSVMYIAGTVAYFVVFCVMTRRYDVVTGIQYSVAYGWIVATCLIFIYHVLFAFGLKPINKTSYAHGSRVNNAEMSIYLFMNVNIDDDTVRTQSTSEVLLILLLALLSLASGAAYMANGGVFFLCGSIVMQVALLVVSAVLLSLNNATSFSTILIAASFYASIFWMDAVFTMGAHGWRDNWGNSLLTILFLMLFFVCCAVVSTATRWKGKVKLWLFRSMWIIVLLHMIGCLVALIVKNYRMGLFVLALVIHLLVCIFRTNESTNYYGMFAIAFSFTAALLACVLLAHADTAEIYSRSVSHSILPDFNASRPLGAAARNFPPLCLMGFPDSTLNIIGMALFAKLGYNTNETAQQLDLRRWFPDFTKTPVSTEGFANVVDFDAFHRQTPDHNTTVIAVRTGANQHVAIEGMTMWVDIYVISFFSFLMPPAYLEDIMPYLSFAMDMSPLLWKKSMERTADVLTKYMTRLQGLNEHVFIVGHGPTGAMAASIGLQSGLDIRGVTFASPVILSSKYNHNGQSEHLRSHYVLNVQAPTSTFGSWYLRTPYIQTIPCKAGGNQCDKLDTTILELATLCH